MWNCSWELPHAAWLDGFACDRRRQQQLNGRILLLMRRTAANLLLVLMFAGLALPLLLAHESGVPAACCRRGGKHHCAMLPQDDGFRAVMPTCPYRHFTALTSHSTFPSGVTALSVDLASENSIALVPPDLSSRAAGNAQKRGPPLS